jgi:hypothetical protein
MAVDDTTLSDEEEEEEETVLYMNPFENPVIDPTTAAGQRLWSTATKGLTDQFNGTRANLSNFIADVSTHCHMCNLEEILRIPSLTHVTPAGAPVIKSLLHEPSLITLEAVIAARNTRNQAPATHESVRARMNSQLLFYFLHNSLKVPVKTHISLKIRDGTIAHDGPTLFKLIMTHVSGAPSSSVVRSTLAELRTISLASYNNDVIQMNAAVQQKMLTVQNNNGKCEDMVHILLEAYKLSTNSEFLHMIINLSNDHADDNKEPLELTDLIKKTDARFAELSSTFMWDPKSAAPKKEKKEKDDNIVALQAKLDKTKKALASALRNNGSAPKKVVDDKDYPAWKIKPPKTGEPHSKEAETTTRKGEKLTVAHHWCPVHRNGKGLWCVHKPEDCKMNASNNNKRSSPSSNDNKKRTSKPKLVANFSEINKDDENPWSDTSEPDAASDSGSAE